MLLKIYQREPQFLHAQYSLAEISIQAEQWEDAILTFKSILEIDRNQSKAHYGLGKTFLQIKNYDRALFHFQQAIEIEPEFTHAYRDVVQALMQLELWHEAMMTCNTILESVDTFPWVYTYMGNIFNKLEEPAKAIACHQKACQLRGWELCARREYYFLEDWFSQQIYLWTKHLDWMRSLSAPRAAIVGCNQGMTACWLLDTLLTSPQAHLVCVDSHFSALFKENLLKSEGSHKVALMHEQSLEEQGAFAKETYDIVVIQGKYRKYSYVGAIAKQVWKLLNIDGMILFRGYLWRDRTQAGQFPKQAIDCFLQSVQQQHVVTHQSYQLFIKKSSTSGCIQVHDST